jgi:hypothetical protein
MKKYSILLLLAFTLVGNSCYKHTPPPLSYLVDTLNNIYVPVGDSLKLPLEVRFLTGNDQEKVKLFFTGLPGNVRLVQDTMAGIPTFTANFHLYTTDSNFGYYKSRLVGYSPSTGYRYWDVNVGVVRHNCENYMVGTFTGGNSCEASNYTYTATSTYYQPGYIIVNNLGGYGVNTNTLINLNCNTDSLYVYNQNIGNGITMTGRGYFSSNQMVISYTCFSTPNNRYDTCTAILNR